MVCIGPAVRAEHSQEYFHVHHHLPLARTALRRKRLTRRRGIQLVRVLHDGSRANNRT
jgi:hypothetical protein